MEDKQNASKEARDFAWEHFKLHAGQRMDMFRSYVTFIGLTYAGYGVALQVKHHTVAGILGLLGIFLSSSFFLFDLRIRQLLKISERFLLKAENSLAVSLSDQDIRLFRKSDLITVVNKPKFRLTYSRLFCAIYFANIFAALISILILPALG
jgi:hypothetical protein